MAEWSTAGNSIIAYGSGDESERTELATLRYKIVGETLQFTDIASGQVVREIVGSAELLAEIIERKGRLLIAGAWVSTDNGPFAFHELPREEGEPMLALPGGGFISYVGSAAPARREQEGLGPELDELRAWTSRDGVTWIDQGSLELTLDQGSLELTPDQFSWVRSLSDRLVAESILPGGYDTITHWQSADGLAWTRLEGFPNGAEIQETSLGYLGWQSESISISQDLRTWTHLVSKPGWVRGGGVAGEFLFFTSGAKGANGSVTLWMAPLGP